MATEASKILRVQLAHNAGLNGRGQIVAVCDTGLDSGDLVKIHPAFAGKVHDFKPYGKSSWDDRDGHGTHVCGCIVGGGGTPEADNDSFLGPAPGARLFVQSVFKTKCDPFGYLPVRMNRVLGDAYQAGARVQSNSWIVPGSSSSYNNITQEIDKFIYEHRDMTVIVAVGNECRFVRPGVPGSGTIRTPGTAKNTIAVGASENRRPSHSHPYRNLFPEKMHSSIDDQILGDGWAKGAEIVTPFSGRGPTAEGRIKPDLVAPGTAILSARSRNADVKSVWGAGEDLDFVFLGGTSSAAALTAGCAAVVRQFAVQDLNLKNPSSALVKALLVNGTEALCSHEANRLPLPNSAQGWGRIDLARSVQPARGFGLNEMAIRARDEGTPLTRPQEAARFSVETPVEGPLRVTLAWTDPPGKGLVSDLDLIVTCPQQQECHGNRQPGSRDFDRKNNVEHVRLDSCPPGEVQIQVRAHRLDSGPQSFALVAAGAFGKNRLQSVQEV